MIVSENLEKQYTGTGFARNLMCTIFRGETQQPRHENRCNSEPSRKTSLEIDPERAID